MRLKKSTIYIFAIFFLIMVAGYFIFANNSKNLEVNNFNLGGGQTGNGVQKIILSYKNYNYYPNSLTVKANQPVEISLDDSVRGCYRAFTISALGLRKNLRTPEDTLIFTPTQKGMYKFACAMGMGTGTLIVE